MNVKLNLNNTESRFRTTRLIAAALVLGAGFAPAALAITVTQGAVDFSQPGNEQTIAARFRSFANTGGQEIFLGIPDLGNGSNRTQRDCLWARGDGQAGRNDITFTYDKAGDKLTAQLTRSPAYTCTLLDYPNVASQAASKGKIHLNDLNVMQFTLTLRDASPNSLSLNNVRLDGSNVNNPGSAALNDFPAIYNVAQSWAITDFDFDQGFALTGSIYLNGNFGSQETSKVDVLVGHLTPQNLPPVCADAYPSVNPIWPPNHEMVPVLVEGVTDPDGDLVNITMTSIQQDEPVDSTGDGAFAPDGQGVGTATATVRAERDGGANGRVYTIGFTASDGTASCDGTVNVSVPKSRGQKGAAVDDGPAYDSTLNN